ncbi:MAG: hypothetical protein ABEJ25_05260 [Candidatus Bipolaricaulia bacterium]
MELLLDGDLIRAEKEDLPFWGTCYKDIFVTWAGHERFESLGETSKQTEWELEKQFEICRFAELKSFYPYPDCLFKSETLAGVEEIKEGLKKVLNDTPLIVKDKLNMEAMTGMFSQDSIDWINGWWGEFRKDMIKWDSSLAEPAHFPLSSCWPDFIESFAKDLAKTLNERGCRCLQSPKAEKK